MRNLCDFIHVENMAVDISSSNTCICNLTIIIQYKFNYSAPVTAYNYYSLMIH